MTSQSLPGRPSLEQLKKQAKTLLRQVHDGDAAARERFRVLPAVAALPPGQFDTLQPALHEAQTVIAREHGFASWNSLREEVENRCFGFAAAVEEFVRCATANVPERAERLLALYPDISQATLQTALVLGESEVVRRHLVRGPSVAATKSGVRNWQPLQYVCHTCLHMTSSTRAKGLLATARLLLKAGADANAIYDYQWHAESQRTLLWGALCVMRHYALAELLLENGANPTDGISLHGAAGAGDMTALALLERFHTRIDGIPGGVPPLRYLFEWNSTDPVRIGGIRWLLEHGADPNLGWGEYTDAPLHMAAQKGNVTLVALLVEYGAELELQRPDGCTAHTLASLNGNTDIAAWLLAHGAKKELSSFEDFVSACARGERAHAEDLLNREPHLRKQLRAQDHLLLHTQAERGNAAALETMLACGFDHHITGREGETALHHAAMQGDVAAVRALLAGGADVNALDTTFNAPPLAWAAQGFSYVPAMRDAYIEAARELIAAGSTLNWNVPDKTPDPERGKQATLELCRLAGTSVEEV